MVIRLQAYSCSVCFLYSFLSVALSDKLSSSLALYLQLPNLADRRLFSSELIQTSLFNSHGHHQLKWLSSSPIYEFSFRLLLMSSRQSVACCLHLFCYFMNPIFHCTFFVPCIFITNFQTRILYFLPYQVLHSLHVTFHAVLDRTLTSQIRIVSFAGNIHLVRIWL